MSVLYNWNNYKMISISNLLQTMKSILYSFGIIYPSYLSSSSFSDIQIPMNWEMTNTDTFFLQKELQNYKKILADYQNELLLPIFQSVIKRVQPLMIMLEYSFSFLFKGEETVGQGQEEEETKKKKFFDFAIFCLELVFMIYIELINQKGIFKKITDEITDKKQKQKMEMELLNNVNSQLLLDVEDEEDMIEEKIEFSNDYLNDIKQKISDYLLAIISTIRTKEQINAKEPFMLTYDDIITKIDYYRDREKQKIKNYFKEMPVEERKLEIELKKLRLGVFAIDNKKLTSYGKDTGFYDNVITTNNNGDMNVDFMRDFESIEDLGENEDELIYANEQDEDNNLNLQEEEDDYEDINENAYEDFFESEYNE